MTKEIRELREVAAIWSEVAFEELQRLTALYSVEEVKKQFRVDMIYGQCKLLRIPPENVYIYWCADKLPLPKLPGWYCKKIGLVPALVEAVTYGNLILISLEHWRNLDVVQQAHLIAHELIHVRQYLTDYNGDLDRLITDYCFQAYNNGYMGGELEQEAIKGV